MRKIGASILFVLLLAVTGCGESDFTPVPSELSFVASINIKEGSITFLDADTFEKFADWKIGEPVSGALLLSDQDRLAVYGKKMDKVRIYSLSSGEQVDEWNTGEGIVHASLVKDGTVAFVNQRQDSLFLYSEEGIKQSQHKVGKHPISVYGHSNQLFVINLHDDTITVLDNETMKEVMNIPVNPSPTGILYIDGKEQIWVGGHGEGSTVEKDIHVYSSVTGELMQEIRASSMPVDFERIGDFIFILSHGEGMLYRWDMKTQTMASLSVGGNPFEMEIVNDKIVLATYDSDDIHLVDPDKLLIVQTLSVGNGPFQIIVRELRKFE
ncbi:MAG: YncE family protein [Bacillus sp. (in: firmicutes)]